MLASITAAFFSLAVLKGTLFVVVLLPRFRIAALISEDRALAHFRERLAREDEMLNQECARIRFRHETQWCAVSLNTTYRTAKAASVLADAADELALILRTSRLARDHRWAARAGALKRRVYYNRHTGG